MVLKLGHLGKYVRNTWKVLKCDAGEGWRRLSGQEEELHRAKGGEEYPTNKEKCGRVTGLVTSCVRNAFLDT